jgi:hypothetical protein
MRNGLSTTMSKEKDKKEKKGLFSFGKGKKKKFVLSNSLGVICIGYSLHCVPFKGRTASSKTF